MSILTPIKAQPATDKIREDLLDVAQQLLDLAGCERSTGRTLTALQVAELIYAQRRQRERMFGADLFGDPAWDIMLDLFIQGGKGQPQAVSAACIGAYVASTTALRWLRTLEKRDLVRRLPDPADRRRIFVTLTPMGVEKMAAVLSDMAHRFGG